MVLDHSEEDEDFDFPDTHYGYLVCTFCRGYYELQEGESPDDFDRCECGHLLEYRSTVQFHSRTHNPDFEGSGSAIGNSYSPDSNRNIDEKQDPEDTKLPDNRQIINKLSQQDNVAEDMLSNIQHDSRDLWDIVEQYETTAEHSNEKVNQKDVVEMNRLMMLVDEKRALEENSSSSNLRSITGRMGPIGLLGVVVVLLVIVLIIVLASELFNII